MKYKCPECGTENILLVGHETVQVSYLGTIDDGVAHIRFYTTESVETRSNSWECTNGHEFNPFDKYDNFQVEWIYKEAK